MSGVGTNWEVPAAIQVRWDGSLDYDGSDGERKRGFTGREPGNQQDR